MMHSSWNPGTVIDITAIFAVRIDLEQAGYLMAGPPVPAGLAGYGWYIVRNEYAYAVYAKIPFCWIHDDLAEHIKEVAKWA